MFASIFFFLAGQPFVTRLGIQNDEALFATPVVAPGAALYSCHIGHFQIPIMLMSYLGCLKTLLFRPILRFFGAGVYRSREAYRGLAAFSLLGAGFLPFVFTCTLSLGVCLGQGILSTGLWLFPYSIGSALVSKFLLPRLYRRMQPQQVGLLAMILLLAGDVLLAGGIVSRQAGWFLGALLLVNSLSIAIGYPAFTVLSLAGVAPEKQGVAAGIQSTLYTVASGLGLSFISLSLDALGSGRTALLTCCGIVGVLCILAVVILASKPKKPYLCPPI